VGGRGSVPEKVTVAERVPLSPEARATWYGASAKRQNLSGRRALRHPRSNFIKRDSSLGTKTAQNGWLLAGKKIEKKLKKKLATLLALHLNEMLADKQACLSVQKKLKKKLVRS